MEKLLNKLIEKERKPRGYEGVAFYIEKKVINWLGGGKTTFRELVSKESGLWQFCVENGMVKKNKFTWMVSPDPFGKDQYDCTDYRYRIIESALCDEDKLENFLLYNIKIDE